MTQRLLRIPAAFVFSTALLATSAHVSAQAQTRAAAPQSPYGGVVVEDILVRVNDRIITQSDYDRAMKEMDDEAKQRGETMQQISEGHKDLLRDLIDRQLWLSKAKELDINGDTELVKRLDDIRKQYHMDTMDDLAKAAKEQGVSYEDFKANIRNQIITQDVMREEVARKIQVTPGEVERYYQQHKQEYAKPESVKLSEILVSTGPDPDDQAKMNAGKAKADDIEAKLHAGGDFSQLAKLFSDGTTAADGGALGTYQRGDGQLAKVFEDSTFALQTGQYTAPIRTRQGWVIFKVDQHVAGGVPPYKAVEQDVEEAYYDSKMGPAVRDYLTQLREESYISPMKPGYVDTGASSNQIVPVYSTYTPPSTKKKKKVERTRFRETAHAYRDKGGSPTQVAQDSAHATKKNVSAKIEKPGKREKIRYGQAPSKTLPAAAAPSSVEDAGGGAGASAATATAAATPEPANPLDVTRSTVKTRYSSRAKLHKTPKNKGLQVDPDAPPPPDAAEVADRQEQATALGENGDTSAKKKKRTSTTTADKTRLADKNKKPAETTTPPAAPAPAPATQQ